MALEYKADLLAYCNIYYPKILATHPTFCGKLDINFIEKCANRR